MFESALYFEQPRPSTMLCTDDSRGWLEDTRFFSGVHYFLTQPREGFWDYIYRYSFSCWNLVPICWSGDSLTIPPRSQSYIRYVKMTHSPQHWAGRSLDFSCGWFLNPQFANSVSWYTIWWACWWDKSLADLYLAMRIASIAQRPPRGEIFSVSPSLWLCKCAYTILLCMY